jgi:hypothetical protein
VISARELLEGLRSGEEQPPERIEAFVEMLEAPR